MFTITVDNRKIRAAAGQNLLDACLENDIYIPNLCHLPGVYPQPASCRLCFVDIQGHQQPTPACSFIIDGPIRVVTDSEPVRRLQRSAFKLLLSVHHTACRSCPANKKCALQHMARVLKVALTSKPLESLLQELQVDDSHPFLDYHPYRCVLCGRCVHVCRTDHGHAALAFAKRGFDTIISSFGIGKDPGDTCRTCRRCLDVCPVAALTPKGE